MDDVTSTSAGAAAREFLSGPAVEDLVEAVGLDPDAGEVEHAIRRFAWRAWLSGARWGTIEATLQAEKHLNEQLRQRWPAWPGVVFEYLGPLVITDEDPVGPWPGP